MGQTLSQVCKIFFPDINTLDRLNHGQRLHALIASRHDKQATFFLLTNFSRYPPQLSSPLSLPQTSGPYRPSSVRRNPHRSARPSSYHQLAPTIGEASIYVNFFENYLLRETVYPITNDCNDASFFTYSIVQNTAHLKTTTYAGNYRMENKPSLAFLLAINTTTNPAIEHIILSNKYWGLRNTQHRSLYIDHSRQAFQILLRTIETISVNTKSYSYFFQDSVPNTDQTAEDKSCALCIYKILITIESLHLKFVSSNIPHTCATIMNRGFTSLHTISLTGLLIQFSPTIP